MENLKRQKVAIVAKSLLIGYGVDEIVNFLADRLSQTGFDITVLANKNEFAGGSYKTLTYKVPELPYFNEFWNNNFLIDLRSLFSLVAILRKHDIIITVDPMHIVGAVSYGAFRKKVIMYYFGIPPQRILNSFARKIESIRQNLLWNFSFFFSNQIVTNSYYTRNLLSPPIKKKAIVNYHGVDHLICRQKMEATNLREELDVGERKLILSVGRFSTPYKGMAQTMSLFSKLRRNRQDCLLLLVGRGSLHDLGVQNLPEAVTLWSKVPFEKLKACFGACDVYCTSSQWEGFDLPLIAAQANGKPVVAYNVGAHEEIVKDKETGFLVDSPTEFLDRISLLISDDDLRKRIGEKARTAALKFKWEKSVQDFENILSQVSPKH